MSDANVQLVQKAYERFGAGDIPGLIALQADDVVWDHSGPSDNPLNKVFEGQAGVGEFFTILDETQEALAFDVHGFYGGGDDVVTMGFMRWRVRATGKEWESKWATRITVADGRVARMEFVHDLTAEAEAFRA